MIVFINIIILIFELLQVKMGGGGSQLSFFLEEYMIITTTPTMSTVIRQKEISFLLVSCWYWLA